MLGSGIAGDPYIIQDVSDLQNISLDLAAYYELGNHIECLGYDFAMLGTLTGSLDGIEFEIRDLTIVDHNTEVYAALFQRNQGTIRNVKLVDCVISNTNDTINALGSSLCMFNEGIIDNCSATGTVDVSATMAGASGGSAASGLVLQNEIGGQINNSFSEVVVTISANAPGAGGFCCDNEALISNCYAQGNVTAIGVLFERAAGFIDHNWVGGVITNAYSTGKPTAADAHGFCRINDDTITACFWDLQTSETEVSDGGTGKTTSQMKQKSTFSGWSIGYTLHYLNDGYPFLSWEIGSSSTWLIYGTADGDGLPSIQEPTVITLPATGVT